MKIILKKRIHIGFGTSSKDVWLEKEIELHFIPYIGLTISGPNYFCETINKVLWNMETLEFECCTEPNKELHKAALDSDLQRHARPIEEIIKDHVAEGWPEPGKKRSL